MKETILYTEINAIGIALLALMFFNFGEKRTHRSAFDQRLFDGMLISNVVILIVDSAMWLLDGKMFPLAHEIYYGVTIIYYTMQPLICFLWLMYCDFAVYADKKRVMHRLPIYALPTIITAVFAIGSRFYPWLFTIDENNIYERSTLFFVAFVFSFIYYLYGDILALHGTKNYRSSAEKRDLRKYLLIFPLPPALGAIIQSLFYGVSMLWVCSVFSLLIIFINLQNMQITTDILTGLNNRRRFERHIDDRLRSTGKKTLLFLLMIDVDDFKSINDSFGHDVGDNALQSVADVLRRSLSQKDFLARIGGDEFVIVGERDEEAGITDTVLKIEKNVSDFNSLSNTDYKLSLSIGTAIFDHSSSTTSSDDMMRVADKNMYEEKQTRKLRHKV